MSSEVAVSENMSVMPAPTDENTIAAHRGVLAAAAITAASAAGELALSLLDANEQRRPFQPTPDLIDDFKNSIVELDRAWRGYVRGGQKGAGPIVHNTISKFWGSDFARAIETALEGYRQA